MSSKLASKLELSFSTPFTGSDARQYALISGTLFLIVLVAWLILPGSLGDDWRFAFRPAAEALLDGRDPYQVKNFMVAPWAFVLLVPLSLLPEGLGMACLVVLGLSIYAFVALRLKARPLGFAAILLSPQVMHNLINGNIDWLVLLGFVLPRQVGLFFLALKPQIGLALGVYWAFEALRENRFLRTFGPFLLVLLASFLIFGFWPATYRFVQAELRASAWPYSLPVGILLLAAALRGRKERIAQAISPLFSPHVMFHSWVTVLYALAPDTWKLVAAVIVSWMVFFATIFIPF